MLVATMTGSETIERAGGRLADHGMLFEYTVKLLVVAGFLELVLYRLVSRLGMHFSKLAEQHEWIRLTFQTLSSIGFTLLNVVSLLVFLGLFVHLYTRFRQRLKGMWEYTAAVGGGTLMFLTVVFLLFPPGMASAIVYNLVFLVVLVSLGVLYLKVQPGGARRWMLVAYLFGISGWLYYQTASTLYGVLGWVGAPPFVHEINRAGEALMVLASILTFFAYGGPSFWSKNRRQRHRAAFFMAICVLLFVGLLFMDYWLTLYNPKVAEGVRKATQGIGWIFQMGMGYTFYLPFALYMAGLLCWSYTVVKQIGEGRVAGYGLALMFIAGYALQLSHLTLMVVMGMMLMTMEVRRRMAVQEPSVIGETLATGSSSLVGERT